MWEEFKQFAMRGNVVDLAVIEMAPVFCSVLNRAAPSAGYCARPSKGDDGTWLGSAQEVSLREARDEAGTRAGSRNGEDPVAKRRQARRRTRHL